MEILSILETLEDLVERSVTLPFTGKSMIDKEEVLEIIKEMRLKLPDDIKQAKWVKDERQRILYEAQREAEMMTENTEKKMSSLIDSHEVTRMAYDHSNEIISKAKSNANEIKVGTREYAEGILSKVENILGETMDIIKMNKEELK